MKAETKERTLKTFLLSQRHIVYTDPVDVKAGEEVTVYYNPSNTVLNGKPEVWFRGSFNQWTHRRGPLLPQKMFPAENGTHVKTTGKFNQLLNYVIGFHFRMHFLDVGCVFLPPFLYVSREFMKDFTVLGNFLAMFFCIFFLYFCRDKKVPLISGKFICSVDVHCV